MYDFSFYNILPNVNNILPRNVINFLPGKLVNPLRSNNIFQGRRFPSTRLAVVAYPPAHPQINDELDRSASRVATTAKLSPTPFYFIRLAAITSTRHIHPRRRCLDPADTPLRRRFFIPLGESFPEIYELADHICADLSGPART